MRHNGSLTPVCDWNRGRRRTKHKPKMHAIPYTDHSSHTESKAECFPADAPGSCCTKQVWEVKNAWPLPQRSTSPVLMTVRDAYSSSGRRSLESGFMESLALASPGPGNSGKTSVKQRLATRLHKAQTARVQVPKHEVSAQRS